MEPCYDVVKVEVINYLSLKVTFEDGLTGAVILKPSHLEGVFEPLRDPSFFNKVEINHGAVSWPAGIDLAPDAMYDAIKKQGQWILD